MEPNKTSMPTVELETARINAGLQSLAINALVHDLAAARVRIAELDSKLAEHPVVEDKPGNVRRKA